MSTLERIAHAAINSSCKPCPHDVDDDERHSSSSESLLDKKILSIKVLHEGRSSSSSKVLFECKKKNKKYEANDLHKLLTKQMKNVASVIMIHQLETLTHKISK